MTNRLGIQGPPERMLLHDSLIVKRPTEFVSVQHIFDPSDVQFIPAPIRPFDIWCPGCCALKPKDEFWLSHTRPNGYQPYCKPCKRARKKAGKQHNALRAHERWYRTEATGIHTPSK